MECIVLHHLLFFGIKWSNRKSISEQNLWRYSSKSLLADVRNVVLRLFSTK